jgi:hypothetical protein
MIMYDNTAGGIIIEQHAEIGKQLTLKSLLIAYVSCIRNGKGIDNACRCEGSTS